MEYSVLEALWISVLGLGVVFFVLVLLIVCISVMTSVVKRFAAKLAVQTVSAAPVAASVGPAPGSCGEISLFDVPDKTAALIMAIVADELDAPLHELHFISIKEVEEETR